MEAKTMVSKYPDRPITMIVAFGMGGSADIVARELEKTANKYLGQPLTWRSRNKWLE